MVTEYSIHDNLNFGAFYNNFQLHLLEAQLNESGTIILDHISGDQHHYWYEGVSNPYYPEHGTEFEWELKLTTEATSYSDNFSVSAAYTNTNGIVSITGGLAQDLTISANGANVYLIADQYYGIMSPVSGGEPASPPSYLGEIYGYNAQAMFDVVDIFGMTAYRSYTTTINKTIGTHDAYSTGTLSASPDGYRVDLIDGVFDTSAWGLGDKIVLTGGPPEIIENGSFNEDDLWIKSNSTISGGKGHGINNSYLKQFFTLLPNTSYRIQADVERDPDAGGVVTIKVESNVAEEYSVNFISDITHLDWIFTTGEMDSSHVAWITLLTTSGSFPPPDNPIVTWDNISIKLNEETIIDTNFVESISANGATLQNQTSVSGTSGLSYSLSRAYPTISAWEADTDNDLVSANEIQKGICYNDAVTGFAGDIAFDGATTDEYRYRHLTVAEGHRHLGVVGQGAFLDGTMLITEPYFKLEHLRFTHPIADSAGDYVIDCPGSDTAKYITINSVLIHDWSCTGDEDYLFGIRMSNNGGCKILNSIITDLYKENTDVGDYGGMAGIYVGGSTDPIPNYIYNCTVINLSCNAMYMKADGGIGVWDDKTIVKNCISMVRQYTADHSSIPNVDGGLLDEAEDYKFDFSSWVNLESGYNVQEGGGFYLKDYMPDLWKDTNDEQLWGNVVCSDNGQYVISNCYTSGVYYSDDFGETWDILNVSATAGISGTMYGVAISRDITYVDALTGHTMVATSLNRIFVSNNQGANWYVASGSDGLPITGSYGRPSISDNGRVMIVRSAGDLPLKISTNYGRTFVDLSGTWTGFSGITGTSYVTSSPNIPLSRKWKAIEISENGEYILATVGGQATSNGSYAPYAYNTPIQRGGRFWVGVSGVGGYTFTEIVSATNESLIDISDFQGCDISRDGEYMIVSSRTNKAYNSSSSYNPITNGIHPSGQVYMSNDYGVTWTKLQMNTRSFDILESLSATSISAYGVPDASVIRVKTATPHRLYNDDVIKISGHGGLNSNCNGTFKVTPIDSYILELYSTYRDYRVPATPNGISGFGGIAIKQNDWYSVAVSHDGQTLIATIGNISSWTTEEGYVWQSDDYGQTWYNNHDFMIKKDFQDIAISRDATFSYASICDIWNEVPDFMKVRKKTNIWSTAEDIFVRPGPKADTGNAFVGYGYHAKDINFDGVYERGFGYHDESKEIYKTQTGESGTIRFDYVAVKRMVAGYEYVDANTFGVLTELIPITETSGGTAFTPNNPSDVYYGTFTYNNTTGDFTLSAGSSPELSACIEMVGGIIQFKEDYIFDWSSNPILPSGGGYVRDGVYPELISASSTQTNLIAGPAVIAVGQIKNSSFAYEITERVYTSGVDLRIKNSAPVISAGTIISDVPELLYDISGQPRSLVAWDIGAVNWTYIPEPVMNNIIAKIQYYRFITNV